MTEIVNLAFQYGPWAVVVAIIYLFVEDPNRAEKLQALVLEPTFRAFKWGSRRYMASKVGSTTTGFLQKYLGTYLSGTAKIKVAIKWVTSPSDPILSENGTLILYLQETNNQTKNILNATKVALPHIVCPLLRPHLKPAVRNAIDLTVLRRLADGLGAHARIVFQRYFIDPELTGDQEASELFANLVEIDTNGIFVVIFLEELNTLGEELFNTGNNQIDKTNEIKSFLKFLLVLARRGIGQEIPLDYLSQDIKVGIILVAKAAKAAIQGVSPYLKRIDKNIKLGCNSIYLVGFAHVKSFLNRVLAAAEGDERLLVAKPTNRVKFDHELFGPSEMYIAQFRVNIFFADSTFQDRIEASGLKVNDVIDGTVVDVSLGAAVVEAKGFNCTISKNECSWYTVKDCRDVFTIGSNYRFRVKSISIANKTIELSKRLSDNDPWQIDDVPEIGDRVEVEVIAVHGFSSISRFNETIEILIPIEEISWAGLEPDGAVKLIGQKVTVIIYAKDSEHHILTGSIRQVIEDPWPQIHKAFPKGFEIRGVVVGVQPQGVTVKLPNGLVTIVSGDSMRKAGFEYSEFERNVVIGQGLDLVVTKVFIGKRKIRLELKRNLALPAPIK